MGKTNFSRSGLQAVMWGHGVLYIIRANFLSLIEKFTGSMVFNNAGEDLHDIGSERSGDGQFSAPTGLAIDKFIVCDRDNDRLQLFTLEGKYLAKVAGSFF